ncbi:MAG: hypothetical protein U9O63_05895 [Actinomycetota bacterium]|nr:hypothetical protein [Actinomycetota bacterium]
MLKLRILLRVVGAIQIVLGLFYLFAPAIFLETIGHSIPADDIFYPLGMLASRFLVLGVVFIYIARDPVQHRLWIIAMIFIQLIDLAVGIFYTATGVVELSDSLFPMFNATWIAALLYLWRPRVDSATRS